MVRGRKPTKEKKGYFYSDEEDAVINYLKSEDIQEKNEIFENILKPAFTKMIESLIRRYKLYIPDEDFQQTFDDTFSFLITKLSNFKSDNGTKAYSYCGTICKHYLLYKINQFKRKQERHTHFEDYLGEIDNNIKFSYGNEENINSFTNEVIRKTNNRIKEVIEKQSINLNENEIKVGKALIEILENWEKILGDDDEKSNKFNKSSILFFLRESTRLNTKEVRDGMKKYKIIYKNIKNKMLI